MQKLKNRTVLITGASRGIGRAIALKCAEQGANIVIAAKSAEPHPKLPGTIFSVAEEVRAKGVKALPLQVDVRFEDQIEKMIEATMSEFGRLDALVNNAGAIRLTPTSETPAKAFDLMNQINTRATFLCTRAALPHLEKSDLAHVLNLSPPITLEPKWLQNHVAYTISKFGMSLCTLGHAAEFREKKIAVNSLWPKTTIDTAAVSWLMGGEAKKHCRKPEIMADAAFEILTTKSSELTGQCLLDETILSSRGISDFECYACMPGEELYPDFYVE